MRRNAGLTLIELLVVIGIITILAAIAVPGYFSMVTHNRLAGTVNALASTFSLARSEAITRGEPVVVCPSKNATASPPSCDNNSGWEVGWLVFADKNEDNSYGSVDVLIRVHGPVGKGVSITGTGADHVVAFNRVGFAQPTFAGGAASAPLTVVACPADGRDVNARAVVLSLSGDISTAARQGNGSPFQCL